MSIAKGIGTAIIEVIMTFDDLDYALWHTLLNKACPIASEENFDRLIEFANCWKHFRSAVTDMIKFRVAQFFGIDAIELFLSTHEDEEVEDLLDHL